MTRQRGGTLALLTAVGLATGVAFAAGSHLRNRLPEHLLGQQATRLAQADTPHSALQQDVAQRVGAARARSGASDAEDLGVGPMETFMQVYTLVRQNYVDKLPDDRKLTHGAVRAMLSELNDPNSYFLEPADRAALDNEARGKFAGIGAALSVLPQKRDGYTEYRVVVVAPLPGSPAAKAGLKPGDVVTHVDGKWVLTADPTLNLSKLIKRAFDPNATPKEREAAEEQYQKAAEAAQARIKGGITLLSAQKKLKTGEGEKRVVTVQRPGAKAPLKFEVTTAATEVAPVTAKTLPNGVGYVKINLFTEASAAAFKQALAGLPKQPGLVLDLRGNPGGLLAPVKEIASALTSGGKLLVAVGPSGATKPIAAPSGNRATRPVVVLVDKGTASSAEALAASLRDKGVGTLVGAKTFGDALEQTLYPLADGSAYTLTTGKLLSPSGAGWQAVGLSPGVAVAQGASEDQVMSKAVSVLRDRARVAAAPGGQKR